MTDLDVHVWSDVACPWCFIGKRRMETALRAFAPAHDGAVTVEYHSFELAPDTPVDFEGSEADFLAGYKRLPRDQVAEMLAHVTRLAAGEGLAYDFDAVRHTRTVLAHQAIHAAKAAGRQAEFVERLFSAYFEQGRHIGHVAGLVALARDAGLDPGTMREDLESGRYADAVAEDIATARRIGVTGVPFYVVGGRYAVSGAQSPEVFVSVLERAARDASAG